MMLVFYCVLFRVPVWCYLWCQGRSGLESYLNLFTTKCQWRTFVTSFNVWPFGFKLGERVRGNFVFPPRCAPNPKIVKRSCVPLLWSEVTHSWFYGLPLPLCERGRLDMNPRLCVKKIVRVIRVLSASFVLHFCFYLRRVISWTWLVVAATYTCSVMRVIRTYPTEVFKSKTFLVVGRCGTVGGRCCCFGSVKINVIGVLHRSEQTRSLSRVLWLCMQHVAE